MMSGQNEPELTEQEIVDMLRNIFEHSVIDKDRLQELWDRISSNYI